MSGCCFVFIYLALACQHVSLASSCSGQLYTCSHPPPRPLFYYIFVPAFLFTARQLLRNSNAPEAQNITHSRSNISLYPRRRGTRLIEDNAKCHQQKKLPVQVYRDFAAGVYLSEAQNPIPPHLNTLCTCIQFCFFT